MKFKFKSGRHAYRSRISLFIAAIIFPAHVHSPPERSKVSLLFSRLSHIPYHRNRNYITSLLGPFLESMTIAPTFYKQGFAGLAGNGHINSEKDVET